MCEMRLRATLLLLVLLGTALTSIAVTSTAWADDPPEFAVTFLGDRFEPADVVVPVDVKVALRIENKSTVAMEWESPTLHREKVVPPGSTTRIYIGPLRAGSYEYFDDFHPQIRGHVVAR